jgi:hypothetical protein
VALKDILDHGISAAEEISVHTRDNVSGGVGRSGSVWGLGVLLAEASGVPDTDCLVKGCRNNEVILGVEASTHNIVVVAGEYGNASPGLPVPDPDSLVIRAGYNPRVLVVELKKTDVSFALREKIQIWYAHLNGTDVVKVAKKGEQAAMKLVIPNLDLVIITTRDEVRHLLVEVNATDLYKNNGK